MQIKKIYKNEARPRPFRPSPQDRSGIYEPVDLTGRAKDKYGRLGEYAKEYRDNPVQYTATLIGKLLSAELSNKQYAGFTVRPHYETGSVCGNGIDSYYAVVELPEVWGIRRTLENLARKEGLSVAGDDAFHAAICLRVGDGPKNISDAHATARRYVDSFCKVLTSLRRAADKEGSRKFGKTSEALDDSIIDEIAELAADLPKGDWHSYEKVKKMILPKYRDTIPVDMLSDAIAAAVGL